MLFKGLIHTRHLTGNRRAAKRRPVASLWHFGASSGEIQRLESRLLLTELGAAMFPLDPTGFGQASGNITGESQSELFRFEPLIGGRYVVEQNADASGLDGYLQVLDENFNPVAFDDDGGPGTDSRIDLFASAGDIFFLEAGSFGSSTGAFTLTVTRDDFDNSLSTPGTIMLDQEGNGSIFGEIERSGDRDVLEITSPLTGILTIQQLADDPSFDSFLAVFDAGGSLIDFNDDFNGLDSQIEVSVNAGDRIYIEAGEAVGSPGFYQVTVAGDFGDMDTEATPIQVESTGSTFVFGQVNDLGDVDVLQVESPVSGTLTIDLFADASFLDAFLTIRDGFGNVIGQNDGIGDVSVTIPVSVGDLIFVEAADFFGSPEAYGLSITTGDLAAPPIVEDGGTIVLDENGNGTASGQLETEFEVDIFEITSTITGTLVIEQVATSEFDFFDPAPTVLDADGQVLADELSAYFFETENFLLGTRLFIDLAAGDVLTIRAGTFSGTGTYDLVIRPAPINDRGTIVLDENGNGTANGQIDSEIGLEVFEISSTITGTLIIEQVATSEFDFFDPAPTVFDADGQVLADGFSADFFATEDFLLGTRLFVDVQAGDVLTIRAGTFSGTGTYDLVIRPAPISDRGTIVLDGNGNGTASGQLDAEFEVDIFEIASTITGTLVIEQVATSESDFFDPAPTVFDADGQVLADEFSAFFFETDKLLLGTRLFIDVAAGDVLSIHAGSFFGTGTYDLVIRPAPINDRGTIVLDENGNGTANGQLDSEIGLEVFEISSTITGTLIIEQVATSEFDFFDPEPTVFNAAGQVLAGGFSADFFVTEEFVLGTRLFVDVQAGDVLTIRAGSFFGTGTYDLVIRPAPQDDFSDAIDLATTTQITLTPDGSGRQTGTIGSQGDRDVFLIQTTAPGVLTIRQNATGTGALDSVLTVLNANGQRIAQNDDSGTSRNSRIDLPVTPGTTLFIRASGFSSSIGDYELLFEVLTDGDDDFGNTVADATPLPLSATGSAQQTGVIEQSIDVDVFSIVVPPETGTLTIRQISPNGELDSFLTILDASGLPILSNDDSNFSLDSEILLPVTPGDTVFIQAGSFPGSAGGYDILIQTGSNIVDDVGSDDENALFFSLDPFFNDFFTFGTIEVQGDRDVYAATFDVSGTVRIFVDASGTGFLDPFLRVRNAASEQVAADDDGGFGLNSQATVAVTAGDQLFFEVGAFADASSGQYFLDILFDPGVITADDFPVNTIQQALAETPQVLTVPENDTLVQSAEINTAQDADVFQVNVPGQPDETVVLRIQQVARGLNFFGLTLDPLLTVFDATGRQIAFNDDTAFSLDSEVVVSLTGGSAIFVQAGAFGSSAGGYDLFFELINDDFGNVPNGATTLRFNSPVAGTIERPGDVDVFQIGIPPRPNGEQVPEEVHVRISQIATDGTFDAFLTVFRQLDDGSLEFVALNDDRNGLDSAIEFDLKRNATYFAFAEAFGTVTGDYQISISTIVADDFSNSIQGAQSVEVAGLNVVSFPAGEIESSGDVDVFTFTSDRNGSAIIEISPETGLDGRVSVFEIDPVANNDGSISQPIRIARTRPDSEQLASGVVTGFTASFPLIQGRQYGVVVDSVSGTGTGTYDVQLQIGGDTFNDGNNRKIPDNVFATVTSLVREQFASGADFDAILDMAVAEFLAGIGNVGDDEFFIFIADPVDFVLADSQNRQVGFTADQGRVNETQGARLSENSPIEVLILPASDRQFSVQLQGVGTNFQVGGRIVTQAGTINGNLTTPTGTLASGSGMLSKDDGNVALVFDFTQESSPGQGPNSITSTTIPRPVDDTPPNTIALVTATDANTMVAGFAPDDQFAMSEGASRAIQALRQASRDGESLTRTTARQNLMQSLIQFLQQSDEKDLLLLAESLESLFKSFNTDDSGNTSQVTELDVLWGLYGGGAVDLLWELGDTFIRTLEADPDSVQEVDQPQPAASGKHATKKVTRESQPSELPGETRQNRDSSAEEKDGSKTRRPKDEQSNSSNRPATQSKPAESQKSVSS